MERRVSRQRVRVIGGEIPEPGGAMPGDRPVTLGVQDLPAARAFALVARKLGLEVATSGDLDRRVSLVVVNTPASTVLDRLAQQAGARWRLVYTIEAPDAPAPPQATTLPPHPAAAPPAVEHAAPAPAPEPAAVAAPSLPPGPELKAALWSALNDVLRCEPARRAEAVKAFLQREEALFRELSRLAPVEREPRLRALLPLRATWVRLYRGLAPQLQRQLAPVTGLLERYVRP